MEVVATLISDGVDMNAIVHEVCMYISLILVVIVYVYI